MASAATALSVSFERLSVESLAIPWNRLESIHDAIHEKRRLVEQHTSTAMESLKCVSMLNSEINALEKEFSAVMSTIVTERTRTQEKIRTLIQEWEVGQSSAAGARETETQQQHAAQLHALQDEVRHLKKELRDKSKAFDVLQRKNDDLSTVLKEYRLDAVGPLLESIQGRKLAARGAKEAAAAALYAPLENLSKSHGSFASSADRPKVSHTATQDVSMSASSWKFTSPQSSRHESFSAGVADEIVDGTRSEVLRLQGELAAARRDARMRREEVEALRSAKEDVSVLMAPAPAAASYSSSASVAASDAAFYHLQQHATSTSNANGKGLQRDHPVAIGLDLGNRRQLQGLAGVHVVRVADGSPCDVAGMQENDVIVAWAGRLVNRIEDIAQATKALGSQSMLEIKYIRPRTAAAVGSALDMEDIQTAVVQLDGRLEGPYNGRRESYSASVQYA